MWQSQQVEIGLEDPTPIVNQVYLGCTQRDTQADIKTVKSKPVGDHTSSVQFSEAATVVVRSFSMLKLLLFEV